MLPKLFIWCYSSIIYLLLVIGFPFSFSKDDYETKTTVISLTRSKTPFGFVEKISEGLDVGFREFRCYAFSSENTTIYWQFKPCRDEECEYEEKEGDNSTSEGLQYSSNVFVRIAESGYLKCLTNNSDDNMEVIQEVVPINNTGQVYIELTEQSFTYTLLEEEKDIDLLWKIKIKGQPQPELTLFVNNQTIKSLAPRYEFKITDNQEIFVKIKDARETEDVNTTFTLSAKNVFEEIIFPLQYNVTRQPIVTIKVEYLNSTFAEVQCRAVSLLNTDIRFDFFKTCTNLKKKCHDSMALPEYQPGKYWNHSLFISSYLKLDSSVPGHLECFANNSLGFIKATQKVAGMNGSLDIVGPKDMKTVDEKTKYIEIDNDGLRNLTLRCSAAAHNHSKVEWAYSKHENIFKDVVSYADTIFSKTAKLLQIRDYGTYYCLAESGNSTEIQEIKIINPGASTWQYYIIIGLVALVVFITVFIAMKMRTYRNIQKEMDELKVAGLANFEKGALELLNPNLTLDDQADLLPYDKSYEIPSENLTLGEQIGSGAFGVVVKGEAKGIFEGDKNIPVAVKMVNRYTGDLYIKALASELKIMIHLGKHVNVVNLLGACTKNIAKRELLVVVEYCRFGNLKDYLLNHRHTFIDQIDKETGDIDFNIGSDTLKTNRLEFPYITLSFANSGYENSTSSISSALAEPETERYISKEPDLPQSEGNPNYKGEYDDKNKVICTKDLLIWSFQIARGMDYLSSRKVLHGDLAARNILLTDGSVVKICDFGLSKNMYQKDVYKKTGDEMLPVKWMAIEAITDKIFSVQSDVWSFGVVLWEIFSLARSPYPGMEYNETFCEKLLNGYRMKAPCYATEETYEIMLRCWEAEPMNRPSFGYLSNQIGAILEEPIREHYIDMNSGYLKMNSRRLQEQNADYLSMVGAPDFKKFSSPYGYVDMLKSLQSKVKENVKETDTHV